MFKASSLFLYLAVVRVSIWGIYCLNQDQEDTLSDVMKPLVLNCLKECDIDEEDFKDENATLCFKKCFLTKIGVMKEHGEFEVEEVMKQVKLYTDNEEDAKKILEALEDCFEGKGKIENEDERVNIIYECFLYF